MCIFEKYCLKLVHCKMFNVINYETVSGSCLEAKSVAKIQKTVFWVTSSPFSIVREEENIKKFEAVKAFVCFARWKISYDIDFFIWILLTSSQFFTPFIHKLLLTGFITMLSRANLKAKQERKWEKLFFFLRNCRENKEDVKKHKVLFFFLCFSLLLLLKIEVATEVMKTTHFTI